MAFPPGQGRTGQYLMDLWRRYLGQYAEREGNVEGQIVIGAYHAAEVFGSLSMTLDRDEKYRDLINGRIRYFREGSQRAERFADQLLNATFALYNHLNTLCRQFTTGSAMAQDLVQQIDEQVHLRIRSAGHVEKSAAALSAVFPLLGLMTLILDRGGKVTPAIRQIEQRFATGSECATTAWEKLLNAVYRAVEMMQLCVILSDAELRDQVDQIAARFQEDDQTADLPLKLRNGFCRLFELGHLLATHLDAVL